MNYKTLLEVKDISIAYGEANDTVRDFSLTLNEGEICCIVGESGSGKTTALRTIFGDIVKLNGKLTKGEVIFAGENIYDIQYDKWRARRNKNMGLIPQNALVTFDPIKTIESQFVEYYRFHTGLTKSEAINKAIDILKKMRLPDPNRVLKSYPFQLSGGMNQRVAIAFAMALEPRLLLADEPTSALDVTTQLQIVRELMALRDKYGTSILLITHNIALATYMADKLIVLNKGEVVDSGSPEYIIKNSTCPYTRALFSSVPTIEEGPNDK